ncbi:peptidase M16 inactive domain-containing protein [Cryptosporidium andersoni]|uniref:Peptidase M16 inactive domain-containing protein n=1 Tax=Cryptosporidium andersoni TaxID=117008 RepID=A0A1J4MGG4_9CRYT|nr:peptidase M16 inactive domain-containing protein [Cryptosporidium andersoni]
MDVIFDCIFRGLLFLWILSLYLDVLIYDSNNTLNSFKVSLVDTTHSLNGVIKHPRDYPNNSIVNSIGDKEFIKPFGDFAKYRFVTLRNKMQVFLVSNSNYNNSLVTMGVRVGSYMDPKEIPGLSTLLKDVLMADESEVETQDKFINYVLDNNGLYENKINYLNTEYTFTIQSKKLENALKLFSGLFKFPKFKETTVQDQINHSKLFKRSDNDKEYKLESLLNTLATQYKGQNETFYSHGYLRQLNHKDINLYLELVKFYKENYSANLMVLCIISDDSLDKLESYAVKLFTDIPNLDKTWINSYDVFCENNHPYSNLTQKIIEMKSIDSDTNELFIFFPIDNQDSNWRYKFANYISYLLTSSGKHDLRSKLISRGWVTKFTTEVRKSSSGVTNFVIIIQLPHKGDNNILRILEAIFSTFEVIRIYPMDDLIWEHIRIATEVTFQNKLSLKSKMRASDIIQTYMDTGCSPEKILQAPFSMSYVDYVEFHKFLDFFIPKNMFLVLSNSKFSKSGSSLLLSNNSLYENIWGSIARHFRIFGMSIGNLFMKKKVGNFPFFNIQPYIHTEYLVNEIPERIINNLSDITDSPAKKLLKIELGPDFLGNLDLTLHTVNITKQDHPILLSDILAKYISIEEKVEKNSSEYDSINSGNLTAMDISPFASNIYYMPGDGRNPYIYAKIDLDFEKVDLDIKNIKFSNIPRLIVLNYLFQHAFYAYIRSALRDYIVLNEYKTIYDINTMKLGIRFDIFEYASAFPNIFSELVKLLANPHDFIKSSYISLAKKDFKLMVQELVNQSSKDISISKISQILTKDSLTFDMLIKEERSIKYIDILDYVMVLLKYASLKGIVIGNCTPIQVNYYLNRFSTLLNNNIYTTNPGITKHFKYIGPTKSKIINMMYLPSSHHFTYVFERNKYGSNQVNVILQLGPNNVENNAISALIKQIEFHEAFVQYISNNPSYITLLDYSSIYASSICTYNFVFISNVYNIKEIVNIIQGFFDKFLVELSPLVELNRYKKAKYSTIANLSNFERQTLEVMKLHYVPIIENNSPINWQEMEISYLEKLSQDDFLEIWKKFINSPRLMVAIQINNISNKSMKEISEFIPPGYRKLTKNSELFDIFKDRQYN